MFFILLILDRLFLFLDRHLNQKRLIHRFVIDVDIWGVVKVSISYLFLPKVLVNMPKNMHFWFQLFYKFKQSFATCIDFMNGSIQDTVRWSMRNQNIHILWNSFPQLLSLLRGIHESPIKEFRRIWASEDSQPLNLNHLML